MTHTLLPVHVPVVDEVTKSHVSVLQKQVKDLRAALYYLMSRVEPESGSIDALATKGRALMKKRNAEAFRRQVKRADRARAEKRRREVIRLPK